MDEIRQEAAAPEAGGLPALTFVMRNMVTVLGLTLSPAMRLRLQPDAARGEVGKAAGRIRQLVSYSWRWWQLPDSLLRASKALMWGGRQPVVPPAI